MSDRLGETAKSVIYHALGWDLSEGLQRFDAVFCEAEDDFDLATIDDLLDLLNDRTLQKEERLAWFRCYSARRALLLGLSQPVEAFLAEEGSGTLKVGFETVTAPRHNPLWQCHTTYLDGQVKVMGGDLVQGLDLLRLALGQAAEAKDEPLQGKILEALAQAHIARARSFGGWEREPGGGPGRGGPRLPPDPGRAAMTVLLAPFYALVWLSLRASSARALWPAVLRYGAEFSNWPIFWHYLNAHRALSQAHALASAGFPNRTLRIQIMQADLLRELCAPRRALSIYAALLRDPALGEAPYLAALIRYSKAQALLDAGQPEEARNELNGARVYLVERDQRAAAYVDLSLGDVALQEGNADQALDCWESALAVFTGQDDRVGLAQVASRSYQMVNRRFPAAAQERATRLVRSTPRRIFPVRVTDRVFAVLQGLTWIGPLIILLSLAVAISRFAVNVSLEETSIQARAATVVGQALGAAAVLLIALICNAVWGILGFIHTLRTPAIHLDLFAADESGLCCYDFTGRLKDRVQWSDVTAHLRVERELGFRPAASLSYDLITTANRPPLRLPAATAWFAHLQEEIEQHTGRKGEVLRLRWLGPLLVTITLMMSAAAAAAFRLTEGGLLHAAVAVRAGAASSLWLIVHLLLFWIVGRWPLHFLAVHSRIEPASRFVLVFGLLGAFLIGLALVAQPVIYLFAPLLILLGALLLAGAARQSAVAFLPRSAARAGPLITGAVSAGGALLVLRALLPIVINWSALAYMIEAQKYDPASPAALAPAERAICFTRMEQAGRWMVAINPTYPFGHGYLGYAAFYREDYEASVAHYSRAIDLGRPNVQWDYYQCRAAARARLGDESLARQDCAAFKSRPGHTSAVCEALFPEDALVCSGP